MPTEVLIPKLGMTMTEGTVAEWHVPDGATVQPGDLIYRLETEKIEFEVEAETAGTVRHIVPQGTALEPGAVVGYILAAGETLPPGVASPPLAVSVAPGAASNGVAAALPTPLEGGRVAASPVARRLAQEAGLDLAAVAGSGPGGRVTEADVRAAQAPRAATAVPASAGPAHDVAASPLARRLAEQLGVDLRGLAGTGPGGRITKEDVEAAAAAPRTGAAPVAPGPQPGTSIAVRGMRRIIAERMHASLQEMAQLTMSMEVAMDDAVRLRTQLIEEWAPEGVRPSYTDLVIKAVAKALAHHPLLNARFDAKEITLLAEAHIGMAVALADGLVVPVVRDAGTLSVKEIAAATSRLAEAARSGSLALDDMAGGTFSVTALGMAGIDFFTPIINPPNVAILGVGSIHDSFRWEGDQPRKAQVMTLSLTIDHRAVDGAPGAAFLGAVRDLLEAPYRLLL
ncbi:MAG: 2-oxo acid dehydrogenase subunit E2 [Tepidiformaceae bacterium]